MDKSINFNQVITEAELQLSAEPVLNETVLTRLKRDTGDACFSDLLQLFIDDTLQRRAQLSHFKHGDLTTLTQQCHAIKGSAATYGAKRLSALSRLVELFLKQKTPPSPAQTDQLISMLLSEIDITIACYKKWAVKC